ncbi:MAG TPA: deoxyribonuclease IV [Desulfobacteria bacterium]|nr:deoxyribonuclease IV [Desulfobacteria bacterium]
MIRVGVHVSIAGSIDKAVDRAQEKGCDTFQIFSRNPRGWKIKALTETDISRFIEKLNRTGLFPPVDHMPYLPNLAAPTDDVYTKSVETLTEELERCNALQIPYLVTHLGSHRGSGKETGLQRIVDAIDTAFSGIDEANGVMLLLENTAGTKNSMGGTFEAIRNIMDRLEHKDRIGICFDTCHAFAAGYELRTEENLDKTLQHFDEVLGLEQLKLIHLNDAKGGLDSRLDRHEHIGLGYIGEDGFRVILNDARLKELPMILETPIDASRDDLGNLQKVRELATPE